jgi:FemAB-related protein (PEP-CTERM system-associated)
MRVNAKFAVDCFDGVFECKALMSVSRPGGSISSSMTVNDEATPTRVVVSEEGGGSEWNAFLATHPSASFYHLYEWRSLNEETLRHTGIYLAARADGEIVGVLPLVLIRSRLFGRILCSMPFVNFGGPCAHSKAIETDLVSAAIARARSLRVDYMELRCTSALGVDLPSSLRKISMTLGLDPDPDKVWNGFTSKHRNNIRRAYKNGLTVRSGGLDLLPSFYSMMERSWHALGTPLYGYEYFKKILEAFPAGCRVFVCEQNNAPIAAAFNGYFNGVVEGMWAGGGEQARTSNANLVLYWEMIKDACERGYSTYHLGRSTVASGGEEFKRKWNAEAKQLHWHFFRPDGGALPSLNVENRKFQLAIHTWKRLPLWATRLVGPSLARVIP